MCETLQCCRAASPSTHLIAARLEHAGEHIGPQPGVRRLDRLPWLLLQGCSRGHLQSMTGQNVDAR